MTSIHELQDGTQVYLGVTPAFNEDGEQRIRKVLKNTPHEVELGLPDHVAKDSIKPTPTGTFASPVVHYQ